MRGSTLSRRRRGGARVSTTVLINTLDVECARGEPDQAGLGAQQHTGLLVHFRLHVEHEGEDVVGRPAVVGLDEVGVLGRHLRAAVPQSLAPREIDESARRVVGRVHEDRSGVGTPRLVLAPPPHDLGDRRLGRLAVAGRRGAAPPRGSPGRDRRSIDGTRGRVGPRSPAYPRRCAGRIGGPSPGSRPCRSHDRRHSCARRRRSSREPRPPTRTR